MRISVIGCGYLDAVHAASMTEVGHDVGAPGRDRTCDQVLRRHLLYPLSYGRSAPIIASTRAPLPC
jgi:UDP-glucose 6-dehydrogenase